MVYQTLRLIQVGTIVLPEGQVGCKLLKVTLQLFIQLVSNVFLSPSRMCLKAWFYWALDLGTSRQRRWHADFAAHGSVVILKGAQLTCVT